MFGASGDDGAVAVEHEEGADSDVALVFSRRNDSIETLREPILLFIVGARDALEGCPGAERAERLGGDAPLDTCLWFKSWRACVAAKDWLVRRTGVTPGQVRAPYLFVNDPVQQHLLASGRALFKGMKFESIRRMQVDIECETTDGFEFCNAEREGDRVIAIGMSDSTGWSEVLSVGDRDEKSLIEGFVRIVKERDPDVMEGHNIFNFDLSYLKIRAKRHRVKLALGRGGVPVSARASRYSAAERTLTYQRFDIYGRHVVDTLFMSHAYDVSHRALDGFGLKEIAIHFGFASPDRTYVPGDRITEVFRTDPSRLMKYLRDDVRETAKLASLLSQSYFVQTQMLPYTYQNVCLRGNATRIDGLMLREYLRRRESLPVPVEGRSFEGGYTDMFEQGVIENVHHCDVRSLYPSLMLVRGISPSSDRCGVFLKLLAHLRKLRVESKAAMQKATSDADRRHHDAMQSALKILINSFYGYLGFDQGRFSDFAAAERVAREGREILKAMMEFLKTEGARPVEMDTDGIYFVPPSRGKGGIEGFRRRMAASLPEGIELEFDGEYAAMFSYRAKNYALLTGEGEVIVKGAALKSRGLEPFQRDFMREMVELKLRGQDNRIADLKQKYEAAICNREWPIARLAKTEILQDNPSTYAAKRRTGRSRSAAYELALKSGREYRAGDQVTYYVTGEKKSVAVHEAARLVSSWSPDNRDENAAYYLNKLNQLYMKFTSGAGDAESGPDE